MCSNGVRKNCFFGVLWLILDDVLRGKRKSSVIDLHFLFDQLQITQPDVKHESEISFFEDNHYNINAYYCN